MHVPTSVNPVTLQAVRCTAVPLVPDARNLLRSIHLGRQITSRKALTGTAEGCSCPPRATASRPRAYGASGTGSSWPVRTLRLEDRRCGQKSCPRTPRASDARHVPCLPSVCGLSRCGEGLGARPDLVFRARHKWLAPATGRRPGLQDRRSRPRRGPRRPPDEWCRSFSRRGRRAGPGGGSAGSVTGFTATEPPGDARSAGCAYAWRSVPTRGGSKSSPARPQRARVPRPRPARHDQERPHASLRRPRFTRLRLRRPGGSATSMAGGCRSRSH